MTERNRQSGLRALERCVRDEYLEMPGQRLTAAQASRLWDVEQSVGADVLDGLVEGGFLRRIGPYYFRADRGQRSA
jgi:hypothetical protein